MNYKEANEYLERRQLNMSRIKMALRGDVLRDKDEVINLYASRPLRKWQPFIPEGTRLWALKKFVCLFFVFLGIHMFTAEICPAYPAEAYCVAGEARGEPYKGQVAVAEVIRTRQAQGKGLSGIYGCKAKFEASPAVLDKALKAWNESQKTCVVEGADHFENVQAFGKPKWCKGMKKITKIGNHTFFKSKKG